MELSPQNRHEDYGSAYEGASRGGSVSLFVRLWTYGGPSQPLSGLALEQEPQIAELIRSIICESKGVIAGAQQPKFLSARFDGAVHALMAAKALQQRFLSFHRETEPQQIVPSILICRAIDEKASGIGTADGTGPEDMLANLSSAQILIASSVYELVKNVPGFQFNAQPVREGGQTGDPEALYELFWTDESTYGNLRQAIRERLNTVGRYQIQEELGRGAMGTVYKAYDPLIGRTVALKVISIDRSTPDRTEMIERLKQEAKAAGKLDHPNIITIYDVGQEDDVVYLSMQFLEGKTLLTLLAESGVPSLPALISWADQISSAVGFAHAHGVIHRDLKPANLMLTNQGVIKVLDFGIAKVESSSLTQTGLVVGTPSHMAPEQVAGKKVDHRADIFALGSVFYELVTRDKPFRGDITTILYKIVYEEPVAPSLINPALPGGIDAIIRKALAKDPEKRFQSCEEMRNAFREQAALLNITPAVATPAGATALKGRARPPATFSLHLLENTYSRRSPLVRTSVVVALTLALMAWGFRTGFHTSSFLPLLGKLVAAIHGRFPGSDSVKAVRSGAQSQPSVSDDTAHSAVGGNHADASTSLRTQTTEAPDNAAAASDNVTGAHKEIPESAGASAKPLHQPDAEQLSSSQPASDGAHTSSAEMSVASTPQTVKATPSPSVQGKDTGQAAAESVKVSNESAEETDSPKVAVTPVRGENQASAPSSSTQPLKKPRLEPAATVDGFGRQDVPELLRQADAAARRGNYRLARYEYNLILRLDHSNSSARAGLNRVQVAEQSH